jgi:hypothetical protein
MKNIVLLFVAFVALPVAALAQDQFKFDVFGGYTYLHSSQDNTGGTITSNTSGFTGAAAYYPGKKFGIVGEFALYKLSSFHQGSTDIDVDGTATSYTGGPRFRFAAKGVTPFVQSLLGFSHTGDITLIPRCVELVVPA